MKGLALLAGLGFAVPLAAQQPAPPAVPPLPQPLAVGTVAPDFTLLAANHEGLTKPFRLSDHRGHTVVIAFFFRARTSG